MNRAVSDLKRRILTTVISVLGIAQGSSSLVQAENQPVNVGNDRQLFVDSYLIESLMGASLRLHSPQSQGVAFRFDKPWDGIYSGYVTVLNGGDKYRMYYRGLGVDALDGSNNEVTCYAESRDGIEWTQPKLGLFEFKGSKQNNIVLADHAPYSHNFSPFLDTRPGISPAEKYKAVAGATRETGLVAFASADGVRWTRIGAEPIFKDETEEHVFDSQNVAFWSASENCYVLYYRIYKDKIRSVGRATSPDFASWTRHGLMTYSNDAPTVQEQLYTNQTAPYFRAPQIYISLAARFMDGREKMPADAQSGSRHWLSEDCSDVVLMSTRGGQQFQRAFPEAFIRPGMNIENWGSRGNYAALGLLQTGPAEMSVYVQREYGLPSHYLERLALRLDGFASIHTSHVPGEMVTKPLTFNGTCLELNYATSAAGSIRVEIQDATGTPISGYSVQDCTEIFGDEIERAATWSGGDLAALMGKTVRLRFEMKEADLYSIRFK
jgi:hypothetical protein